MSVGEIWWEKPKSIRVFRVPGVPNLPLTDEVIYEVVQFVLNTDKQITLHDVLSTITVDVNSNYDFFYRVMDPFSRFVGFVPGDIIGYVSSRLGEQVLQVFTEEQLQTTYTSENRSA